MITKIMLFGLVILGGMYFSINATTVYVCLISLYVVLKVTPAIRSIFTPDTGSYVMLMRGGAIRSARSFSEADLLSVDDGHLDLLDISDSSQPKFYQDGSWHVITNKTFRVA